MNDSSPRTRLYADRIYELGTENAFKIGPHIARLEAEPDLAGKRPNIPLTELTGPDQLVMRSYAYQNAQFGESQYRLGSAARLTCIFDAHCCRWCREMTDSSATGRLPGFSGGPARQAVPSDRLAGHRHRCADAIPRRESGDEL